MVKLQNNYQNTKQLQGVKSQNDANKPLIITGAYRHDSEQWICKETTFDDFKKRFVKPVITSKGGAGCFAMIKLKRDGGPRTKANTEHATGLRFDFDNITDLQAFLTAVTTTLDGIRYILHSTHSHSLETPKFHLIIFLSRPIKTGQYKPLLKAVEDKIGISSDPKAQDITRLFYYPTCTAENQGLYKFIINNGEPLNVDKWINKDVTVISADGVTVTPEGDVPANWDDDKALITKPTEKTGIIGLFNRTFSITDVIEKYLSDIYLPTNDPNRYTYFEGSTEGGLHIHDDDTAVYSYHSTDLLNTGHCYNAFDLVRTHLYGHLDMNDATPMKQKASYIEMVELAENAPKVIQQKAEELEAENAKLPASEKWKIGLKTSQTGQVQQTRNNLGLILENDENLKGLFAYNIFAQRKMIMFKPVWDGGGEKYPRRFRDEDEKGLRVYLETHYQLSQALKTNDVLSIIFIRNQYNPVTDYLLACEKNVTPLPIDTVLIDNYGAEDTIYTREATILFFVGMVKRAFQAGCKLDTTLTLVGPQGCGKSTFGAKIGGEWFSDSFRTFEGKEAYEQLHGFWLVEIAELSAMKRSEIETVKQFLTKQIDTYRPAYGKELKDFPRQNAFLATTNDNQPLKDKTGNRRLHVIDCRPEHATSSIWDVDQNTVDGWWAMAVKIYRQWEKEGQGLYLTGEAAEIAKQVQADHMVEDTDTGIIEDYLNKPLPNDWKKKTIEEKRLWLQCDETVERDGVNERKTVCTLEVLNECFDSIPENRRKYKLMEIADTLRSLGWTFSGRAKQKTVKPYGRQRFYVRPCDDFLK